jgi:hypothetical protein
MCLIASRLKKKLNCFYFETAEIRCLFSMLPNASWRIYFMEACSNEKCGLCCNSLLFILQFLYQKKFCFFTT